MTPPILQQPRATFNSHDPGWNKDVLSQKLQLPTKWTLDYQITLLGHTSDTRCSRSRYTLSGNDEFFLSFILQIPQNVWSIQVAVSSPQLDVLAMQTYTSWHGISLLAIDHSHSLINFRPQDLLRLCGQILWQNRIHIAYRSLRQRQE